MVPPEDTRLRCDTLVVPQGTFRGNAELYKMGFFVPFTTVGNGLWKKKEREMGLGVHRWHFGFRIENARDCWSFVGYEG